MGELVPLADYLAAREAQRLYTCPQCPYRQGCEDAGERLWCDPEPDLNLRLVPPPDIIA